MKFACCLVLLVACSSPSLDRPKTFGGDRPAILQTPAMFDDSKTYPLVMVLHGYGANGFVQEAYFNLGVLAPANEAYVIAPDGLTDSMGEQFWNADPDCCDFDHTNPDDSGYLAGLIADISAAWPVDRVMIVGHSNGGYMAYRMACDHADVIGNIVVLAGDAASDPTTCVPVQPVEVLHLHGDQDTEVPYATTAMRSVLQWAQHDGCTSTFTPGGSYDLDASLPGAETTAQIAGCPTGIDVELWTIAGGTHVPNITGAIEPVIYQWFLDHPRSP